MATVICRDIAQLLTHLLNTTKIEIINRWYMARVQARVITDYTALQPWRVASAHLSRSLNPKWNPPTAVATGWPILKGSGANAPMRISMGQQRQLFLNFRYALQDEMAAERPNSRAILELLVLLDPRSNDTITSTYDANRPEKDTVAKIISLQHETYLINLRRDDDVKYSVTAHLLLDFPDGSQTPARLDAKFGRHTLSKSIRVSM